MVVAILLGNRMYDDGTMSDIMRARLQLALKMLEERKPDYLILSGGGPNKNTPVTEAEAMYDYLLAQGVNPDILIKEGGSNVTSQNAKNAVPLAKELGADVIILCSSRWHIQRKQFSPIKQFTRQLKGTNIKLETYSD